MYNDIDSLGHDRGVCPHEIQQSANIGHR